MSQKIISLLEEDYDTLRDEYANDTMKLALDKEQIDAAKQAIGNDWGKRISFGKFYISKVKQMGQSFKVVQINVSYEHVSVTYTISFDEDMKLAGLYIK